MAGQGRWGVRSASVTTTSVDADATAFIAAAGITDTTQRNAVNTLVTNLKTYGIWSKMKAIYPFVGGTATTHKFNLKNPADSNAAFRLGFYGGVTHNSNGVSFDGTTGGAFTYFNAFVNQTKNNLHMSVYARTRPTRGGNTNDINMLSGYGEIGWTTLRATSNSSNSEYFGTSDTAEGSATLSNSTSVGFSLGSRTSSTSIKYYKNTTSASGTGGVHNNDFKNVALTLNGNASGGYSAANYAFASLGDGLTDAEAANFYTAVETFQTTLGRQVGVPIVADTDAQAFLNATAITNTTQASAINTLVTNLKTYGIWSKMKAIYPMVGGNATTHKFNLKDTGDSNAAFRLQFNGGGTHDSNGYNMNGTNAYADTYFNPSLISGFNNNNHYSIYLKTETPVGGGWHIGVGNTNTANTLFGFAARRNVGGGVYNEIFDSGNNSQNGRLANSVPDGRGFFIGSKTAANSRAIYRNSTQILSSSLTVTSVTPPNDVMYIGAMKGSSGSSNLYLGGINSFTTIGDGLTDTEAANFYSAVQIFQSTLGRHEGVPIVSDTDAQAFINAATITNSTQASAVNTLVTSLKSYGIWSKMKAIYPFVGGTANSHKFNLKDPRDLNAAFRLGFYGGMTHDSNGVLFGGSNGGAFTYFNPFTNQAKNDLHMSVYARTRPTRFGVANDINLSISYVAAGWTTLRATSNSSGYNEYFGTSDTAAGTAGLASTEVGFSLGSRTSSTAIKYYKNTTSASGNGASHTADFLNAELTLNGSSWNYYSAANYAFASLGNGLTDAEAANFYIAVQAFQTTLGRQV